MAAADGKRRWDIRNSVRRLQGVVGRVCWTD